MENTKILPSSHQDYENYQYDVNTVRKITKNKFDKKYLSKSPTLFAK